METLRATILAIGNFFSTAWDFIVRMYENAKEMLGVSDVMGAVTLVLVTLMIIGAWINRKNGFFRSFFSMFICLLIGLLLWSIHPVFLFVLGIWWAWKMGKHSQFTKKD
ncbi:MAG: hypothetical protein IKI57_06855 [Clostridia bacterium]|nr:hypothetical protein [Clostridia bacterium]